MPKNDILGETGGKMVFCGNKTTGDKSRIVEKYKE